MMEIVMFTRNCRIRVLPYMHNILFPNNGFRTCRLVRIRIEADCFKANPRIDISKTCVILSEVRRHVGFDMDLGTGTSGYRPIDGRHYNFRLRLSSWRGEDGCNPVHSRVWLGRLFRGGWLGGICASYIYATYTCLDMHGLVARLLALPIKRGGQRVGVLATSSSSPV